MFILHIFETCEDHYDCVCGAQPLTTLRFVSEEAAQLWLSEEWGDAHPYISTPEQLAEQRLERSLHPG